MRRIDQIMEAGIPEWMKDNEELRKDFIARDLWVGFCRGAEWADTHQGWRLCKDELPSMGVRVLVVEINPCGKVSRFISKRISHDVADPNCTKWHWTQCTIYAEIVAWYPLPEFDPKEYEL